MNKTSRIKILIFAFIILCQNISLSFDESSRKNTHDTTQNLRDASVNDDCVAKLKDLFKEFCNSYQQIPNSQKNINADELKLNQEFYNEIIEKTKPYASGDLIEFPLKYTKHSYLRVFPIHSSATKKHIYDANKIPLDTGYSIAAQGPYEKTFKNFFALLGEHESSISVSLVHEKELANNNNKRLRSLILSNTDHYTIDPIKDETGKGFIRDKYDIQLIDYYVDSTANLEYELFLINHNYHFRIYYTNWIDNQASDLNKIVSIIIFIEKIKKLSIFNSIDSPIVVNCNAGVGRAGTFISLLNIIKNHLSNKDIENPAKFILKARESRNPFVFTADQYSMIKFLSKNPQIIDSLIKDFFSGNYSCF